MNTYPYADVPPRLTITQGYAQLHVRRSTVQAELMCHANTIFGNLIADELEKNDDPEMEQYVIAEQTRINKINTRLRGHRPYERTEPINYPAPPKKRLFRLLSGLAVGQSAAAQTPAASEDTVHIPAPRPPLDDVIIGGQKAIMVLGNLKIAGEQLYRDAETMPDSTYLQRLERLCVEDTGSKMLLLHHQLIYPHIPTQYRT